MTKIKLDEISMVDYPAHLVNGFPIMKAADQDTEAVWAALGKRNHMPTEQELAKAIGDLSIDDLKKALEARADFEDVEKAFAPKVDPKDAKAKADAEEAEKLSKSLTPEVLAEISKRDEKVAELEAKLQKSADDAAIEKALRLDTSAISKSKETYTNLGFDHDTVAPALRKFAESDSKAAEAIETMLKAVNEQADGAIFGELGTSAAVTKGATAEDGIIAKAKELQAADTKLSYEGAVQKALTDPANKALVDAYFGGK